MIGGGLAGLAAAAALGGAGHSVRLFEARPFLGGRATSYEAGSRNHRQLPAHPAALLRQPARFLRALGVESDIAFYREFIFIEPGGRRSVLRARHASRARAFHRIVSRAEIPELPEKLAIAPRPSGHPAESSRAPIWTASPCSNGCEEQRQPPRAIERFWRQVLVSAINEELDRMAAAHGFQVFCLAFLAASNSYEMGVPAVPLARAVPAEAWQRIGNVRDAPARAGGAKSTIETARSRAFAPAANALAPTTTSAPCPSNASPPLRSCRSDVCRVRALAHHRHSSVVRPPGDRSAARHAARPHHPVDVQQERGPLHATGGERVAQPGRNCRAPR